MILSPISHSPSIHPLASPPPITNGYEFQARAAKTLCKMNCSTRVISTINPSSKTEHMGLDGREKTLLTGNPCEEPSWSWTLPVYSLPWGHQSSRLPPLVLLFQGKLIRHSTNVTGEQLISPGERVGDPPDMSPGGNREGYL